MIGALPWFIMAFVFFWAVWKFSDWVADTISNAFKDK